MLWILLLNSSTVLVEVLFSGTSSGWLLLRVAIELVVKGVVRWFPVAGYVIIAVLIARRFCIFGDTKKRESSLREPLACADVEDKFYEGTSGNFLDQFACTREVCRFTHDEGCDVFEKCIGFSSLSGRRTQRKGLEDVLKSETLLLTVDHSRLKRKVEGSSAWIAVTALM